MNYFPSSILAVSLLLLTLLPNTNQQCSIPTDNDNKITLGSKNVLCLVFTLKYGDGSSDKNQTFAFPVTADEFTGLTITNLTEIIGNTSQATVTPYFQNNVTTIPPMILFSSSNNTERVVFSIVINSNQGNFSNITDDNADCESCFGDTVQCIGTKCYNKNAGTFSGNTTTFFISWIGTDTDGNHFLSHTRRLSRFRQYSVGSIYDWVKNSLPSLS